MAKQETDKCRFPSIYNPGSYVTAAQWLAEYVTQRQAKAKGVTLGLRFWDTNKEWKAIYLFQLRTANALFKLYSVKAIGNVLRSKEGAKVYSLNAKWLDPLFKREQERLDRIQSAGEQWQENENQPKPTPISRAEKKPFEGNKSVKSKLAGL